VQPFPLPLTHAKHIRRPIANQRMYLLAQLKNQRLSRVALHIIICLIAIAYNMGQIIKLVCVCQCVCLSVCLSVCEHSHGRISWSIFTKIGIVLRTPKRKNEFVGGQYRTTLSPILSLEPPF